jgi:hypothetical protein
VQTWVNLRVVATSSSGLMPVPVVSQMVTVGRGVLDLATQASSSVAAGGTVSDTATLTKTPGTAAPTGTVTFSVYGPSDTTCSATPVGQSTNGVGANGTATSSPFPVNQAGVYRFVVVYNGDANYISRTSPCNAAGESVTVTGRPSHAVADFNGDGRTDISVYRPSTNQWLVQGMSNVSFGSAGDVPVPGDYNGDGRTDIAVYRPSTGQWFVQGMPTVVFGASGDVPEPGDYNGDGRTDIAVFRPSNGLWLVRGNFNMVLGTSTDIPLPLPYAIRRTLAMT